MTFVRACAVAEVPVGTVLSVDLGGPVPVAIVNTKKGVFAIQDACSHAAVALSSGEVAGCTLECAAHGARFDLRNGRPLDLPATTSVPTYPVRLDGADIFIDLQNPIDTQEQ
jgi:3-phenylpropionate/trans-cinnamate dioxygenase ferredoxin component